MNGIVRFGEFELDHARFELRERGEPVSIQPKVLRLLMLLVAERDRCVSDQELLEQLWPQETVSRASIKRAVMGARTALRDRGQGCIRTVRGHGYQFVLPVEGDSGEPRRDATSATGGEVRAHEARANGAARAVDIDATLASLSLSQACLSLLSEAAVLGRDFSVGLLTQLADEHGPEEILALLSEGTAAGVLQSLADSPGHMRFIHEALRDALHERIPLLERARLHARAGFALEARSAAWDEALLAEMTRHFVQAAPTHDGGRALRYTRCAAATALKRHAYDDAAEHMRRALQVLELGAPDPRARMEILLARGEALTLGSERSAAREALLQAAAIARELGETDVLARAASLIAPPRESGLTDDVRIDLLREALAALPRSDERTPYLQALLAKSLSYTSEYAKRPNLAREALALTRQMRDPLLRAQALQACHEAFTEPETRPERLAIADELARVAHEHGHPYVLLHASTARVQNGVECGDMASVDAAIGTIEALAQHEREPMCRWYAKTYRAMRAIVDGRLAAAERLATEARALRASVGEDFAYHGYCAQMSGIYRFQGRAAEAEVLTREVAARHPTIAGWRATLGCIEAELGHKDLARETLKHLMDGDLVPLHRDPYLLSVLCPLADLCARVGDASDAARTYQALLPYEAHHGNVSYGAATHGPIALHLARLASRMGDIEAAQGHCSRGITAAETMPSPTFTAIGCLTNAYLLARVGRPEALEGARILLRRAWRIAETSDVRGVALQCRALGNALGETGPQVNAPS